jgi:hypothetical protein
VNLQTSVVAAMLLGVAASAAQTDPHAIMEHSVQAIEADWKADPDYEYLERDQEIGGGSKTFHTRGWSRSMTSRFLRLSRKSKGAGWRRRFREGAVKQSKHGVGESRNIASHVNVITFSYSS